MRFVLLAALVCIGTGAHAAAPLRPPSSLPPPSTAPIRGADISTTNCRTARLAAARMSLFRPYFVDVGIPLGDAQKLEALAVKAQGEVCYDAAGPLVTPSGKAIAAALRSHVATMASGFRLKPDEAQGLFQAGLENMQRKIEQQCGVMDSAKFLSSSNAAFESAFDALAFGRCGRTRALNAARAPANSATPTQKTTLLSCMAAYTAASTRASCGDPRADGGPAPDPLPQGGAAGPPKQEKTYERKNADGSTDTKTVTTMPDGSRRETVEKTSAQGQLVERTTSDYDAGATAPSREWVQAGDQVTEQALTKRAQEARDKGLEAQAQALEADARDLKQLGVFLKGAAGVSAIAAPELLGPYLLGAALADGFSTKKDNEAWSLRNQKNKICLFLANFTTYAIPSDQGGTVGTLVDALESCQCSALGNAPGNAVTALCAGDRACTARFSRCRSSADETRLRCLRDPYGANDAPRKECLDALAKDNPRIGDRNRLCGLVKCPSYQTARATVTKSAYADPALRCDCVSAGLSGASSSLLPPESGYAARCEDGKVWRCDDGLCGCMTPGGEVPIPPGPEPR